MNRADRISRRFTGATRQLRGWLQAPSPAPFKPLVFLPTGPIIQAKDEGKNLFQPVVSPSSSPVLSLPENVCPVQSAQLPGGPVTTQKNVPENHPVCRLFRTLT